MITTSDGKHYDDETYSVIFFPGDREWTVLAPWKYIDDSHVEVHRRHMAKCEREQDAIFIAILLNQNAKRY